MSAGEVMPGRAMPTLLTLPGEIRDQIWLETVRATTHRIDDFKSYRFDLALLRTCKQIYEEADRILHIKHTFIVISTPFEEAHAYVHTLADIPIIAKNYTWRPTRLAVEITAPRISHGQFNFVILAEDLLPFCNHWFNQDLDRPGMNGEMVLALKLTNLEAPGEKLVLSRQRQLLEPFGRIKALNRVDIFGSYPEAEAELRKTMSVPLDSPTQCLLKAQALKDEGNLALKNGQYQQALDFYKKAFQAIYIRIDGRVREVHGEVLFQVTLETRAFDDELTGQIVYFLMRTRLVANTMEAYLKLEDWSMAHYWGMRSIELLGSIAGPLAGSPNPHIPGTPLWGKIYYRTGVAAEKLHDLSQAREMYRTARAYLPYDESISEAVARTALKLG